MKSKINRFTVISIVILAITLLGVFGAFGADVSKMTVDALKSQMGSDNLIILDARAGRDWSSSEFKIKGAVRVDPSEFSSWSRKYPNDSKIILYCA